jgi:hypothetical protein
MQERISENLSTLMFASVFFQIIVVMVILSTSIERGGIATEDHSVYEENKMISKQFSNLHSALKKRRNNKKISVINCYLKWDDHAEEKSYLEKMHNEIIKTPDDKTLKSLHNKFGCLGYLREEVYDGQSYVMKYLFSEAWSEEGSNDYNTNNKKEGYCNISSDVLKARLPKAIKITLQTEKLEYNKKNKITRLERQRQQQQKKKEKEEEHYSPRVKSLKDFVQLFEQKEKEGKKPRIYVSY